MPTGRRRAPSFLPPHIKEVLRTDPNLSDYDIQHNTQQVIEGYRRFRESGYDATIDALLTKPRFDSMDTATALVMMAEAKTEMTWMP